MTDCSCVYVDVDELAEFVYSRDVKAKKEHKCTECGRTIEPGEKYEYTFGKWGGDTHTFKTCSDCLSIRRAFFCASYNFTSIWNDLFESLQESDANFSDLEDLTDGARKRFIEWFDEWFCDDED